MIHRHLGILTALFLTACSASSALEQEIRAEIEQANYCQIPADCVDVGSVCPFDCHILVHSTQADRITGLLDDYQSTCAYSCVATTGVDCVHNECVVLTEQPAEEPAEEPNPEGNVGAACTRHEECETPMSYLVRSICPFGSLCIDGSCAVTCPIIQQQPVPGTGQTDPVACTTDADCDCGGYTANDVKNCRCVDNACVAIVAE